MKKVYDREVELSIVVDIAEYLEINTEDVKRKNICEQLGIEMERVLYSTPLSNSNEVLGEVFVFNTVAVSLVAQTENRYGAIRLRVGINDPLYPVEQIIEDMNFLNMLSGVQSATLHDIVPNKYKFNVYVNGRMSLDDANGIIDDIMLRGLSEKQIDRSRPRITNEYKMFTYTVTGACHKEIEAKVSHGNSIKAITFVKLSSIRTSVLAHKESPESGWEIVN